MPLPYRAPEVILDMEWGKSIDSWSVGLLVRLSLNLSAIFPLALLTCFPTLLHQAWDLLEKESLFGVYNMESLELNDAHHLAAMTALLGPPPPEFLKKSEETKKYWTEDGELIAKENHMFCFNVSSRPMEGPCPITPREEL